MTSSKTYIVNYQATEIDALDSLYVETLADIIYTATQFLKQRVARIYY